MTELSSSGGTSLKIWEAPLRNAMVLAVDEIELDLDTERRPWVAYKFVRAQSCTLRDELDYRLPTSCPSPCEAGTPSQWLRSARMAFPYCSSRPYFACQVVYMKPATPLTWRAAASHCWKFVRSSPS